MYASKGKAKYPKIRLIGAVVGGPRCYDQLPICSIIIVPYLDYPLPWGWMHQLPSMPRRCVSCATWKQNLLPPPIDDRLWLGDDHKEDINM